MDTSQPTAPSAFRPEYSSRRGQFVYLGWFVMCVIGIVLLLAVADLGLREWLHTSGTADDVVDIQGPGTLAVKLDRLARFRGRKIVLLGDSLVLGQSMRDHGDPQWREHVLSETLRQRLDEAFPEHDHLVLNLGMNGALPRDLERLVAILVPLGIDLLIFDVTLRSLSSDFAPLDAQVSRPWLHELSAWDGRGFTYAGAPQSVETLLARIAARYWFLYNARDFLQWRLFGGEPRAALEALRDRLDSSIRGEPPELTDQAIEDQLLLGLRARARYAGINLSEGNPQLRALKNLLAQLASSQQRTVAFYATENPETIGDLVDIDQHAGRQRALARLITEAGPGLSYVGPIDSPNPSEFLDHVHVDAAGYRRLVDHLWGSVTRQLDTR